MGGQAGVSGSVWCGLRNSLPVIVAPARYAMT
jgi:hypothetical protein